MNAKKRKKLPTPKELSASMQRLVMEDGSLIISAKRDLEEYIAMSTQESNIFGYPDAKIDPEWHEVYDPENQAHVNRVKRKQIVCCIVQQLYAEHLGLT